MNRYTFDVFTSSHDDVKDGRYETRRSRVVVIETSYGRASELAACIAVGVHGGMPTAILPRY